LKTKSEGLTPTPDGLQKGEAFRGGIVSRKSVASLVVRLATTPALEIHHSLGVSKPE
jgi:hypothetical protein